MKYPSVTQILAEAGITNYDGIAPDILEAAAAFGTAVHLATALYDQGILAKKILAPELKPYLNGWIQYRKDTGLIILEVEPEIFSKKYGTIGHPDRIVMLRERKTVIELKSTAVLMSSTAIQTAGYQGIYNEGKPIKEKIKDRLGVLLKPDGTYQMKLYTDKGNWSVFLAALTIRNWRERNGY